MELMPVEPPLAGEINQVIEAMPGSVVPLAMFFTELGLAARERWISEALQNLLNRYWSGTNGAMDLGSIT